MNKQEIIADAKERVGELRDVARVAREIEDEGLNSLCIKSMNTINLLVVLVVKLSKDK